MRKLVSLIANLTSVPTNISRLLLPQFVSERSLINLMSRAMGKFANFLISSNFVVFLTNGKLFRQ